MARLARNGAWRHIVLAGLFAAALCPSSPALAQSFTGHRGDINFDGTIDVQDVKYCYFHIQGFATLPPEWFSRADVNGDLTVNNLDLGEIRLAALDIFPAPRLEAEASDPANVILDALYPRFGPPGTRVIIRGQRFIRNQHDPVVRLNGVAMTLIEATSTRLVVLVPSGATSGNIVVEAFQANPSLGIPFVVGLLPRPLRPLPPLQVGQLGFGSALGGEGRRLLRINVPVVVRCDPADAGAAQVYVYFDPTVVQCTGVVPGDSPIGSANLLTCIDNVQGGISLLNAYDHLPPPATGADTSVTIAVLQFNVIRLSATGTSFIGISIVANDNADPVGSIGGRWHPEPMQSRMISF